MGWNNDEIIHGFTDTGSDVVPVTLKEKMDAEGVVTDALIAPGHVADIQRGVDHVHAWGQNTDEPDHHDLLAEGVQPLFPM
jgi:hypothetical protein